MFPASLHLRLQLWHGFLLAAVLTGLSFAAWHYQSANELRRVDRELQQHLRPLSAGLPGPRGPGGPGNGPPPGAPPPPVRLDREFRLPAASATPFAPDSGTGLYYVIWRRDGSENARSATAPAGIARPPAPAGKSPLLGERSRDTFREAYIFTPPGECLLVGRSIQGEHQALAEYARWLAAIAAAVLVLGLGIGWWITSRALRPIAHISSTARRITRGAWGDRIPVSGEKSELDRLSSVLNETFAQLEDSLLSQTRFTADAAHELRTPVAVILAQAQHALARERDPATYRAALQSCIDAARRLNQLTESLLDLSTPQPGPAEGKHEPADLATIAAAAAAPLQILATGKNITLTCVLDPAPCTGDPVRLGQIISNLLSNALDHTPEGGTITLRTGTGGASSTATVTDTGCGIAPEHLPRLFDRFYRVESSRNRRTGGAGLGLAICKSIADAHSGTLEVTSTPGHGSVFTLSLPRA